MNKHTLQFIRDNVMVDDIKNKYHLDICDKCKKIVLHTSDYMNWEKQDGDFLERCHGCNLKVCYLCIIECCGIPSCKDCKSEFDLYECINCKSKHFIECFMVDNEQLKIDGMLCCISCETLSE